MSAATIMKCMLMRAVKIPGVMYRKVSSYHSEMPDWGPLLPLLESALLSSAADSAGRIRVGSREAASSTEGPSAST